MTDLKILTMKTFALSLTTVSLALSVSANVQAQEVGRVISSTPVI